MKAYCFERTHGMQKKDNIEVIRFIEAFAVVCFHIPLIRVGSFGVDIFFIISGLVMMLSTECSSYKFF
jgi:peptidoglycan/LPS O-acetylase OafA/YrhL